MKNEIKLFISIQVISKRSRNMLKIKGISIERPSKKLVSIEVEINIKRYVKEQFRYTATVYFDRF